MYPPLCICNGLIRSGSTWSFNVCRELMQRLASHHQRPFGSTYMHSPMLDAFVTKHWARVPGFTVVKAHELGPAVMAAVESGNARGVSTFRDPRDCVASDMVFMGRGFQASVDRVSFSLECLRASEMTDNVLMVRYEDMMADRHNEIRGIARHMGINADLSLLSQVDSKTNIESSKQVCQNIKDLTIREVFAIDSHRVDPQTHLHENHIGNAKIGRWRDELSTEQGEQLTRLFSHWLAKWGYEKQPSAQLSFGINSVMVGSAVQTGSAAESYRS